MELWVVALYTLFWGTIGFLFVKKSKAFTLMTLLWLCGAAALIYPAIMVLSKGIVINEYVVSILTFDLRCYHDPLSVFFLLITVILSLIYLFNNIKASESMKNSRSGIVCINLLMLATILELATSSGAYILLSLFLINILSGFIIGGENAGNSRRLPIIISQTGIFFVTLTVLLLSVHGNGTDYMDMIKTLSANNLAINKSAYLFMFLGAALPAIFSSEVFSYVSELKERYSVFSLFFIRNIIYTMQFYIFMRFIGMGIMPDFGFLALTFISTAVIILFYIYRLIKANSNVLNLRYMSTIGRGMSVLAVLVTPLGYSYNIPIIAILGVTASLVFYINTITVDLMLSSGGLVLDYKKYDGIFKLGILSHSGLPLTVGFLGWICVFTALLLGIFSKNIDLKIISLILIVALILIIVGLGLKIIMSFKYHREFPGNELLPIKKDRICLCTTILSGILILFSGIFINITSKIIFCPTSLMVGGTKYAKIFEALSLYANYFTVFLLILIASAVIYAGVKTLLYKFLQRD